MSHKVGKTIAAVGLSIILIGAVQGAAERSPTRNVRQEGAVLDANCSRSEVLADMIEHCARPLMDILEGNMNLWPQNEDEIGELCSKFQMSEKCIREKSRKCASGLNKVIISTVANSFQRTRKRECQPNKYTDVLRLTRCIEHNIKLDHLIIANATGRMSVVEKMGDLVQRTNGICCTVEDIEREIVRLFTPRCPDETKVLQRLYRSVLEDVLEIICPAPKCHDPFKGYTLPEINYTSTKGLVAYIMRIVFSLGD